MDLPHACEMMQIVLATDESALDYDASMREYTIAYLSDGSVHVIPFCPFCGARLPESLHDAWFARLEALGIDPATDDVPADMRDDRWWRAAGL